MIPRRLRRRAKIKRACGARGIRQQKRRDPSAAILRASRPSRQQPPVCPRQTIGTLRPEHAFAGFVDHEVTISRARHLKSAGTFKTYFRQYAPGANPNSANPIAEYEYSSDEPDLLPKT